MAGRGQEALTDNASGDTVLYEDRDGVAFITLNRPHVLNAFDDEMLRAMKQAFVRFAEDDLSRVMVIVGTGDRAFCTGADLKRPLAAGSGSDGVASAWNYQAPTPFEILGSIRKPVITAVNGHCIAGGMLLLLNSDIRIASLDKATFQLSEVRIGGFPGGGAAGLLAQQIPYTKAMSLLLTGRRIGASEAVEMGLVTSAVRHADLLKTVEETAREISQLAPLSLSACKETVRSTMRAREPQIDRYVATLLKDTRDRKEGREAFAQGRQPRFDGR